jgi:hypothetical protein
MCVIPPIAAVLVVLFHLLFVLLVLVVGEVACRRMK